jgi:hypothetical protein
MVLHDLYIGHDELPMTEPSALTLKSAAFFVYCEVYASPIPYFKDNFNSAAAPVFSEIFYGQSRKGVESSPP